MLYIAATSGNVYIIQCHHYPVIVLSLDINGIELNAGVLLVEQDQSYLRLLLIWTKLLILLKNVTFFIQLLFSYTLTCLLMAML